MFAYESTTATVPSKIYLVLSILGVSVLLKMKGKTQAHLLGFCVCVCVCAHFGGFGGGGEGRGVLVGWFGLRTIPNQTYEHW